MDVLPIELRAIIVTDVYNLYTDAVRYLDLMTVCKEWYNMLIHYEDYIALTNYMNSVKKIPAPIREKFMYDAFDNDFKVLKNALSTPLTDDFQILSVSEPEKYSISIHYKLSTDMPNDNPRRIRFTKKLDCMLWLEDDNGKPYYGQGGGSFSAALIQILNRFSFPFTHSISQYIYRSFFLVLAVYLQPYVKYDNVPNNIVGAPKSIKNSIYNPATLRSPLNIIPGSTNNVPKRHTRNKTNTM